MEITDFKPSEVFSFEGEAAIWGEKVNIGVECENSSLEVMLPMINNLVAFLENNKAAVVEALAKAGIIDLAEDWACGAEEAEDSTEEHECYIMEDGSRVYFPITKEDFAKALHFDGISVYYDEDEDDISASVYFVCKPDYFAYHCIETFIDSKGNIEVNGLAG